MRNKKQQQQKLRKMKIKASREETSQTKTAKTKQNGTKSSQKYHWVHFVFMSYSWAWGLPWSVVEIPSETPLEKTDFLCQWEPITDTFWVRDVTLCQLSTLSAVTLSGLNLYWSWTCSHSLCDSISTPVLLHLEGTGSLEPTITSGA